MYLAGILALLVLGTACALNPATGRRDFVTMTEAREIALGREYHQQVLQAYRVYDDSVLTAYVKSVGRNVASHSHRTNLIYHFTVLDSPEVNAFALPGGYIYITRGLMAYLGSEAELAAVLGHEIGHVTARHSVRQYSAQQAAQFGYLLGSIVLPELGSALGNSLYSLLGGVLIRGYGRDMELEADTFGAQYMVRTGYDSEAMLRVIGALKDQEVFESARAKEEDRDPQVYHGLFSTHPSNDQRLSKAVKAAEVLRNVADPARAVRPLIRRAEFLRRLEGLSFGDSGEDGVLRGRDFYHAGLDVALRFPEAWRVTNLPQVLLAEAASNDGVLQVSLQDLNRRIPPVEFMQSRLGLKLVQGRAIRVGSFEGYTALATVKSPWGTRSGRVTVVYQVDRAWIFVGVAKTDSTFRRYDPSFLEAAHSLRVLAEDERALTDAMRIRIIEVDSEMTYTGLAARSRLPNYPEAHLRLLNGQYPRGELLAGTSIKVVE